MLFASQYIFVSPTMHEVLELHISSLTQNLYQVQTSERHTIKPWLAENIGFSPNVQNYSHHDFPLTGARIENSVITLSQHWSTKEENM